MERLLNEQECAGISDQPLTFYITWNYESLPEYGPHVVVLLLGEEVGCPPRYLRHVRAVFKTMRMRPYLRLNRRRPGRLESALLLKAMRDWVRWLRSWILMQLPPRAWPAPVWRDNKWLEVPLGYQNLEALPMVSSGDRPYDAFFCGPVSAPVRGLKSLLPMPKTIARRQMIEGIKRLEARLPAFRFDGSERNTYTFEPEPGELSYSQRMMNARFCLAPRGNVVDSFRFFEGMASGCCVVCEPLPDESFYKGAPVIELADWRKLAEHLEPYLKHPEKIQEMQNRSLAWWHGHCSPAATGRKMAEFLQKRIPCPSHEIHDEGRDLIAVPKEKDIRFLTIVSTLTRGGTERAAVNYALGYQRAGVPSAVLAYNGAGPRKKMLDDAGIPVFVGGPDSKSQSAAIEQARAWAPDILHLNRPGLPDPLSGSILRALLHPRLRAFETNVFAYVDDTPDRLLFDLHFHLSQWSLWKWTIASKGLKGRAPGVVIPNLVDATAFSPSTPEQRDAYRDTLGIPHDAVVFGRIGQPLGGKWSPILIDGFCATAEQFPKAWLVVVGCPKEFEPRIESLPQHVRARIKQLPLVNTDAELQCYYGSLDVFAHASQKGESFGMVLAEAMLCGLPVITLSTPLRDNSQIEVVRNGITGLVVKNQREFTGAMLTLAKDENLRRELGGNGPAWVKKMYDIAAITPSILDLARLSLAANSAQELARNLASNSQILQAAGPGTERALLRSAGITPSFKNSSLASVMNWRSTRQAIRFTRLLQQWIRG
jgi:glycosyltransferase involved in cell wall biosynthesis